MTREAHHRAAAELWAAEQAAVAVEPLRSRPGIAADDAYAIQLEVAALRRAAGHRDVGWKVGLTSAAMQRMAGVDEPDYGHLFDVMAVADGGTVDLAELVQPRVEPELAFVLAEPLHGRDVSPDDVLAATAYVAPALEIIDSRIRDWDIAWVDTVADNGSSARFVVPADGANPAGLDLAALTVRLARNGEVQVTASMEDVLGGPALSVCWLVKKLAEFGGGLAAGDVVLPGSPCRAIDVHAGDRFEATIDGLGSVSVALTEVSSQ